MIKQEKSGMHKIESVNMIRSRQCRRLGVTYIVRGESSRDLTSEVRLNYIFKYLVVENNALFIRIDTEGSDNNAQIFKIRECLRGVEPNI